MTPEDEINADYERVSAEHRAQRVQHWKDRFAPLPEPDRGISPGALDPPDDAPVTPSPSSTTRRFGQPAPRRSSEEVRAIADEILKFREEGKTLAEIAVAMGLSKTYVDKILSKQIKLGRAVQRRGLGATV